MRSRGSDFRKWEEAEANQLKFIVLTVRSPPISSLKNSDLARSGQLVSLLVGCRPIKSVSQARCCPRQHTRFGPASFISSPRCVRRRNQEDEEENSDHAHVCMYFFAYDIQNKLRTVQGQYYRLVLKAFFSLTCCIRHRLHVHVKLTLFPLILHVFSRLQIQL